MELDNESLCEWETVVSYLALLVLLVISLEFMEQYLGVFWSIMVSGIVYIPLGSMVIYRFLTSIGK